MNKRLLFILLSLLPALFVTAQPRRSTVVPVRFGLGESDASRAGLPDSLRSAVSLLGPDGKVDSAMVRGYVSPDGGAAANAQTAARRTASSVDAVRAFFPGIPISGTPCGVDWDGLREGIDRLMTFEPGRREELLEARAIVVSPDTDTRKSRLMDLRGGKIWWLLSQECFAALRRADVTLFLASPADREPCREAAVEAHDSVAVEAAPIRETVVEAPAEGAAEVPVMEPVKERRIAVSVGTNLLVPLSSICAEVPVSDRLSVAAGWYSPWIWPSDANKFCFEFQAADVWATWWFGSKAVSGLTGNTLAGHSVFVGAFGGHYDIERDYHGYQGELYGAYAGYGYSFTVGRRMRLTLAAGLGYARNPSREYRVYTDGGKLIRVNPPVTETRNWFGPVKAAVTLSVPIYINRESKGRGGLSK